MAAAGGMSLKSLKDDLPLLPTDYKNNTFKFRKMFNIAQEYKEDLEYIKSNMKLDSLTSSAEIKEQIISNIISDINCMPKYKWELYWSVNMLELTDHDRTYMSPSLVEAYDHWKYEIIGTKQSKKPRISGGWVFFWIIYTMVIMIGTAYFLNR